MKKKSFMLSVLILAVGGLIAKIIGAVYRIPLTYVLGAEGLGLYQLVFPLYSLLIILSSSGVPTAIAKMVSERAAKGKVREINQILGVSLVVLSVFGLIGSLLIFFGADAFAGLQGNASSGLGFRAIAPAVFLVAVLSSFRGYFQGLSQMGHTAVSQILEQVAKLVLGLIFAYMFVGNGLMYGAFGAVLGVTISEVVAVIYMVFAWLFSRKKLAEKLALAQAQERGNYEDEHAFTNSAKSKEAKSCGNSAETEASQHLQNLLSPPVETCASKKTLTKELVKTALPITFASIIIPLTFLVDSLLVVNLLKSIGYSTEQATILYGLHSGVVNSVINMPVVITLSIATALVPAICFQVSSGKKDVSVTAAKAIRVALLLALPCMLGLMLLSPNILEFLYDASLRVGTIDEPSVAALILRTGSFSVLFLAMLQVFTSILQSLNLARIPVYSLLVASVVKIGLSVALIMVPSLNILGATIANIACFFVAALINFIFLKKRLDVRLSVGKCLVPVTIASLSMIAVILGLNWALASQSAYISLPITLVSAALVYSSMLFVLGGADDFRELFKRPKA